MNNKQRIEVWENNDLHKIKDGLQYEIDNEGKEIISIGLTRHEDRSYKAIVVYIRKSEVE